MPKTQLTETKRPPKPIVAVQFDDIVLKLVQDIAHSDRQTLAGTVRRLVIESLRQRGCEF